MIPIPKKLREELSKDPYYKKCALTGWDDLKIEWCHIFSYSGKRIQEKWNILPLAKIIHDRSTPHKNCYNKLTRVRVELIALSRVDIKYLKEKYPKRDWEQIKTSLVAYLESAAVTGQGQSEDCPHIKK